MIVSFYSCTVRTFIDIAAVSKTLHVPCTHFMFALLCIINAIFKDVLQRNGCFFVEQLHDIVLMYCYLLLNRKKKVPDFYL